MSRMKELYTEAWESAKAEGLSFFYAHMHVGHTMQFVGTDWESGGFHVDDDGNPITDPKGNTVAQFRVEDLSTESAEHVSQVAEWWGA